MALSQTERLQLAYYAAGDLSWATAFNAGQEDADDRLLHISTTKEYGSQKVGTAWSEEPNAQITSNGHGLSDEDVVECEDFAGTASWIALNGNEYVITVVDINTIALNGVDSSAFGAATAGNVKQVYDKWSSYGGTKTGTVWTATNPAVITSAGHGLATGDTVRCTAFAGGTWGYELNGTLQTITVLTVDTFELDGVNSSGFGVATSGDVKKYTRVEDPNDWDGASTALIGHYIGQHFYSENDNKWWTCTVPGDGATAVWVDDTELPVDPEDVDDQSATDAEFQNVKLPATGSKPTSLKEELETLRYAIKMGAIGVTPDATEDFWYDHPAVGPNILPNPTLGHPETPATDPPDGWAVLASPTISRLAMPLSLGGNGKCIGILGTGTDDGIRRTIYGLRPATTYLFVATLWKDIASGDTIRVKFGDWDGAPAELVCDDTSPNVYAKLLTTPGALAAPQTIDIYQDSADVGLAHAAYVGLYECHNDRPGFPSTIMQTQLETADTAGAITLSPAWADLLECEITIPGPGYMLEAFGMVSGQHLSTFSYTNDQLYTQILVKVGAGAYVSMGECGQFAQEESGDFVVAQTSHQYFLWDAVPGETYSIKIQGYILYGGDAWKLKKGSRLDVIARRR